MEDGGVGQYEVVDQGADQGHLQAGGGGEECEEDGQDGAEVPAGKDHLQELLQRGLSCAGLAIHQEGGSVVGGNLQSAFRITDQNLTADTKYFYF